MGQKRLFVSVAVLIAAAVVLIWGSAPAAGKQSRSKIINVGPSDDPSVAKFKQNPVWHLFFEVTVKGEGEEAGPEKTSTWRVDRKYSIADIPLDKRAPFARPEMSPQEAMAVMADRSLLSWSGHFKTPRGKKFDPDLMGYPFLVKIDDSLTEVARDTGEAGAFEKTTTTTTWTFDSEAPGSAIKDTNIFAFEADLKKLTYNVRIRVFPDDDRRRLKVVKAVEIERSKYGHGNLPMHEAPTPETKMVSVNSVLMPEVKGLFIRDIIRHAVERPLNAIDKEFEFDSGKLNPIDPVLRGIPKSINVDVRVRYKIFRVVKD
jgi:hypothetical protein